jgi:hypothetical protein
MTLLSQDSSSGKDSASLSSGITIERSIKSVDVYDPAKLTISSKYEEII